MFAVTSVSLSGCRPAFQSSSPSRDWQLTDLRAIDPGDDSVAGQDLLAAYVRQNDTHFQIRLDFLDPNMPQSDLYLALDHAPGGVHALPIGAQTEILWDTLLTIPAKGPLQVLDANLNPVESSGLSVIRDPLNAALIITLRQSLISGSSLFEHSNLFVTDQPRVGIQVFLTGPGETGITDQLTLFFSDGAPPDPAPALLAFWNTLPAYTPALALRRWDGAHTGPLGGRHGLYNLLRTARNSGTPLALLDLKTPLALSGLDYLNQVEVVRDLYEQELLLLPDTLPGYPPEVQEPVLSQAAGEAAEQLYRRTPQLFGFADSPFLFIPSSTYGSLPGSRVILLADPQASPLTPVEKFTWRQSQVIPVPAEAMPEQLSYNGLSPASVRALIETALSPQEDLLIFGGSLPDSAWGNPQSARAAFHYIDQHPWIQILNQNELLALQAASGEQMPDQRLPDGREHVRTWVSDPVLKDFPAYASAAAALSAPIHPSSSQTNALREIYLQQAQALSATAHWTLEPRANNSCEMDLDGDGKRECVLASESVWALLDPESGGLVFLFVRSGETVHQLIGPSWQLAAGLSEPADWDLQASTSADPAVLNGAFLEEREAPAGDSISLFDDTQTGEGRLNFTGKENGLEKTYSLLPDGLQIAIRPAGPYRTQIPLALDPWRRNLPGWANGYKAARLPDGVVWEISGGPRMSLRGSANLVLQDFSTSRRIIGQPEDPNREIPPGYYLPMPLAVVDLQAEDSFSLQIRLEAGE